MKFYDTARPLYLETNASGISLTARLSQVRECMYCGCVKVPDNTKLCPIAFASKSLLNTEWYYSNIECEAIGILYRPEKFHHSCLLGKYA